MKRRTMKKCALLVVMLLVISLLSSHLVWAGEKGLGLTLSAELDGEAFEGIDTYLDGSSLYLGVAPGQRGSVRLDLHVRVAGMQDLYQLLVETAGNRLAFSLPLLDNRRFEADSAKLVETLHLDELAQQMMEENFGFSVDPSQNPSENPVPGFTDVPFTAQELSEAFAPYAQILSEHISKGAVYEETDYELKMLGTKVQGNLLTYAPSDEEIVEILTKTADLLSTDERMADLVHRFAEYMRSMQGILTVHGADGAEMDAEQAADALEEGYAQLPENIRMLCDQIAEGAMEGIHLIFKAGEDEDGNFRTFTAFMGDGEDSESSSVFYELGVENGSAEEKSSWCAYAANEQMTGSLEYEGTAGDGNASGRLALCQDRNPLSQLIYQFDLNTRSAIGVPYGTAALQFPQGDAVLAVAAGRQSGDDHILSLNLPGTSDPEERMRVRLTLNTDNTIEVKAPSGRIVDISEYTEEELSSLAAELADKIGSAFYAAG